jgi:sensor histidine kinase YesM
MLLQPYVENAILHGLKHKNEKGHLHIKITTKNNMLVCSIEDDGIGRKKAAEIKARRPELHVSKGLGITEQRLKMLHEAGGGTTAVTITDPINKNGEASGTSVEIRIPYEKD